MKKIKLLIDNERRTDPVTGGVAPVMGWPREAQMAVGGVKASGYGRVGEGAAIADFTALRWSTVEDAQQRSPF
ncbi:MAG TPA: hypothetical protein VN112_07345 [Ensifer sp.]|nr:hypothetical protein [Ensifer sp.]